jgi:hypothetical protein
MQNRSFASYTSQLRSEVLEELTPCGGIAAFNPSGERKSLYKD